MSASHLPNALDGNTSVTRWPTNTISATRHTAGTTSHPTSRTTPPTPCERTQSGYPVGQAFTPRSNSVVFRWSRRWRMLGAGDLCRSLDRLMGLTPPRDIRPRGDRDPGDAEGDAGQ